MRGDEGGLYSQKIFGPINDYRCECGKYARMKHRGVVCETCGVEVIQSRVRRERFGHIDLAQPCVHPQLRDQAATLLGLSRAGLDEMLAGEGGRAVRERLAALDLDAIDATETGPRADLALTLIEAELPATALMLEVVAVLPPDLRPIPSELGDQYARLMEAATTSAAQSAVDALFDSLAESVQRAWREQVFTKALDYSGAAHLTVDPSLAPRECRVPRPMITELFKPFVYHLMEQRGFVTTIKSAKRMVEQGTPEAMRLVEEASAGYPLLLAAGPNLVSRTAKPWDAPAIAVDPDTARRLSSRTVAVHLPLTDEGALECAKLDDLPYRGLRHPRGWLSRAMLGRDLLAGVRTAALKQERELLDDVVLERAFGRPPPPPNAAELARWRDERRTCASAFVEAHPAPTPEPPAQNPSLDRLVDELELSVASANALARAEIRTIRDLCRRTEAELLKTAGFGRKSLREIKEILADMGLSLGMVL